MNCQELSENLSAYLDGELESATAEKLKAHLESCLGCGGELDLMRRSAGITADNLDTLALDPALWNRVQKVISDPPEHTSGPELLGWLSRGRWIPVALSVAATIVFALGLWRYLEYRQEETAIQSYMVDYLRARNDQELRHQNAKPGTINVRHTEFEENPFVTVEAEAANQNPFLGEAQ